MSTTGNIELNVHKDNGRKVTMFAPTEAGIEECPFPNCEVCVNSEEDKNCIFWANQLQTVHDENVELICRCRYCIYSITAGKDIKKAMQDIRKHSWLCLYKILSQYIDKDGQSQLITASTLKKKTSPEEVRKQVIVQYS